MADPMRIRAQVQGDRVMVRVLVAHEMESGQRRGADGKIVPAWYIQHISATHNGKTIMSAQWGPAVSKNPFVQFAFRGGKAGDEISLTWRDNRGESRTDKATIA